MKSKYIFPILFLVLAMVSCYDDAQISVTNRVNNVRFEKMSYGEISLYQSLLPGETSTKKTISEEWDDVKFPMTHQLKFYMVSGDKKVMLYTKESYSIKADQHLEIVIDNDTEVINPLNTDKKSTLRSVILSEEEVGLEKE